MKITIHGHLECFSHGVFGTHTDALDLHITGEPGEIQDAIDELFGTEQAEVVRQRLGLKGAERSVTSGPQLTRGGLK